MRHPFELVAVGKQWWVFVPLCLGTLLAMGVLQYTDERLRTDAAPPGYSYHPIGDFDVDEQGIGGRNFTYEFVKTEVFKQLTAFGYIEIRYPKNNLFCVRFGPWHIKIASKDVTPARVS